MSPDIETLRAELEAQGLASVQGNRRFLCERLGIPLADDFPTAMIHDVYTEEGAGVVVDETWVPLLYAYAVHEYLHDTSWETVTFRSDRTVWKQEEREEQDELKHDLQLLTAKAMIADIRSLSPKQYATAVAAVRLGARVVDAVDMAKELR